MKKKFYLTLLSHATLPSIAFSLCSTSCHFKDSKIDQLKQEFLKSFSIKKAPNLGDFLIGYFTNIKEYKFKNFEFNYDHDKFNCTINNSQNSYDYNTQEAGLILNVEDKFSKRKFLHEIKVPLELEDISNMKSQSETEFFNQYPYHNKDNFVINKASQIDFYSTRDGDTIDAKGVNGIRFSGIDTPEATKINL
ncbi:hypothetical protein NPA07_02180 [Mycoplasmopsis caviae]|uniref:Lipoprotein n=1 Tax=Mycoplasmopsis caviae TaxID=55603 RepID=A0A3P8MEE6_9BACT|nr:hypothetical protein [Mycoplasmopsis caviae]UUD35658.1 hypothetical protein NPA07_02180 [Mycoplasmopsis caviae]VDR41596.1 Uncharacterised protein [Mycoplasmopsis caviae]